LKAPVRRTCVVTEVDLQRPTMRVNTIGARMQSVNITGFCCLPGQ
jgi:hypothetical protein